MKIAKKLTVKEFGNLTVDALRKLTEAAGDELFFVGRIYGSTRAQEVVETPHGVAIKFKGEFRGVGYDGEEVFSSVCYLPAPADDLLSGALNGAQGEGKTGSVNIEFGFDFYTAKDKGITGYKYVCKPLVETAASDPVARLAASFAPVPLKLAAEPQLTLGTDTSAEEAPADGGKGGKAGKK